MKFCPQCGSTVVPDDRFCQECGFDTSSDQPANEINFKPVDEPEVIHKPEKEPIVPPLPYEPAPKHAPVIPPEHPAPVPAYIPPVKPPEYSTRQKGKKTWLFIVLGFIAIGALGVGGWFVYNKYFTAQTKTPVVTQVNTGVPEITAVDSIPVNTKVPEPPAQAEPLKPKATTNPQSSVDQKIAKEKAKEQNKPAKQTTTHTQQTTTHTQQTTTHTQQTKPDQGVEVSPGITANDYLAKVILKVGRKEDSKNKNPKNPVKLTIKHPTMIVRITTDHYNDGRGVSGGVTISIKDRYGIPVGNFMAKGKSGINGAPNAKWVAEPHKMLDKGTYFIWDSDMSTWSKTVTGMGFVVVEGYEIK
ncbi:MAG: zinc-ribbon domain-containing protein [Bacteroidetes bacterium]|nr:zinc-ribbon domain-containing protein [Bacteroidota bacterium]